MLCVWVHGCDPGRVSDGSRLALFQTLSIECPSSIVFWHVYFAILVPFSLPFLLVVCVFFCSHWSLVDVPLISFCPADHVPDWQPRIVLGMVEARSVNVKKTTTLLADVKNPTCRHKVEKHHSEGKHVRCTLLWTKKKRKNGAKKILGKSDLSKETEKYRNKNKKRTQTVVR